MGLDCRFVKKCKPGETAPLVSLPADNTFYGMSSFRGSIYHPIINVLTTHQGLYNHSFNIYELDSLHRHLTTITPNKYYRIYDSSSNLKQIMDLTVMIKAYKDTGYIMECSW